jgi:hypothetical protein
MAQYVQWSPADSVIRRVAREFAAEISCGELTPAVLKGVEDIAVATAEEVVRYPPYVDCPGNADRADMKGWGIWRPVAAPIPAVADDGKSAHGDGRCRSRRASRWAAAA